MDERCQQRVQKPERGEPNTDAVHEQTARKVRHDNTSASPRHSDCFHLSIIRGRRRMTARWSVRRSLSVCHRALRILSEKA